MASPAQLRMVESIWGEVTKPETEEQRDAALRKFLFRFFKVSHMKFLDVHTVSKVLFTLKEMQQREKAKSARGCEIMRSETGDPVSGRVAQPTPEAQNLKEFNKPVEDS
jgi:hypothetical protein